MPELSTSPEGYVYRGVHADHPSYAAALTGVVVPGDVYGAVTPEEHNLRDVSAHSPYTSWTHIYEVAVNFASSRGPGGLVLRLPLGPPAQMELWRWEGSPDGWLEEEILLHGVRMGAEVTRL